jgi:glucokinase
MFILAGDIGGTKSLLALAQLKGDEPEIIHEHKLPSSDYQDISALIRDFLARTPVDADAISHCTLAVAGPIIETEQETSCQLTNLPWLASTAQIEKILPDARATLINDFAAVGYALPHLHTSSLVTLQEGHQHHAAPRLAVGAGTGLGICLSHHQLGHTQVFPSEGGHVGFSPDNQEQQELLAYWMNKQGFCSREWLLSGPGIARIAEFLQMVKGLRPDPELAKAMQTGDPSAALSDAALQGSDALATRTLALFTDIYASQLGNLALTYLPGNGLYIAGGVAPRIQALLQTERFIETFTNKPPMQALLKTMPVYLVTDTRLGLTGALHHAAELG